jgi:hypothetical protein
MQATNLVANTTPTSGSVLVVGGPASQTPQAAGTGPLTFAAVTGTTNNGNFTVVGGQYNGNVAGGTNFAGMLLTNSPAATGWLTPGLAKTVPALGFVSVNTVVTNNALVWLTNLTTHYVVIMGNTTGLWTNYDNGLLPVNLNDSVVVTNIGNPAGWTLVSSYFQKLQ